MKFTMIGEYCQKITNILQNMQNGILMELKNVEDKFIACLGASGFKKDKLFYKFGGVEKVMELFGKNK